ncbi:hypothetical protein [Paenibacillus sp. GYB003]|uniref:hypothetical protein n=1 Tax=Paenibacillus sp. GYB003 TaxID=2994392 RepID=UPI002F966897
MNSNKRQLQIESHLKNGELYIEIEDELNLDNYSKEEISLAVKEGVRIAVSQLLKA